MWYSRKRNLSRNKSLVNWQEEEKLQHSFEAAMKDLQHKEPLGASILTLIEANLQKNFGLETYNQYIEFTEPTNLTNSIGSISVIGFIGSTININAIEFIGNI
jgi:hypothetical protein